MSLKENLQKLKDGQPIKKPAAHKKAKKKAAPKKKTNGKVISKRAFTYRQFAHKLIQNSLNAKAAYHALRPDVTARTAEVEGSKLLRKPELIRILTPLLEKLFTEAGIETTYVFRRWLEMSQATAADYFTFEDGVPKLDMSNMTEAQRKNIREIKVSENRYGTNYTIKVVDQQAAVDAIAKHLGLLIEKLAEEDIERVGDLIEKGVNRIRKAKDLEAWREIVLDAEFSEVR